MADYFVRIGHPQQEHETRHGSMSNVRWSVDGPDEEGLEVGGRRFSTNDEGAPMMCSLVCQALGRHVHIDYCRAETSAECRGNNEVQHITKKLRPEPDRAKDFLTHNLFWKRSGKLILGVRLLQYLTFFRVQRSIFARRASKLCKVVSRASIVPIRVLLTPLFQVTLCVLVRLDSLSFSPLL